MKYILIFFITIFTSNLLYAQEAKLVLPIGHTKFVNLALFSPDGNKVVTVSDDQTAKIWDAKNGTLLQTLEGHSGAVRSACFLSDGKKIATGSADGTAKIWDVETGKLLSTQIPKTDNLLYYNDLPIDNLKAVETDAGKFDVSYIIQGFDEYANYSPDRSKIITPSNNEPAKIWDAKTGQPIRILKGDAKEMERLNISADNNKVVGINDKGIIKIWNANTGELIQTIITPTNDFHSYFKSAVFSPDGNKVVSITNGSSSPKIWDANTGKLLKSIVGHNKDYALTSASFSSDNKRIVTSSVDKTAKIWDAVSGKLLMTLTGHTSQVASTKISPDGTKILISTNQHSIWDIKTGKLYRLVRNNQLYDLNNAYFSPDGSKIISEGLNWSTNIWDAANGEFLFNLPTFPGFNNRLVFSCFSSDGKKMLVTENGSDGDSKSAAVWDLTNGKRITYIKNERINNGDQSSWSISPDGEKLITVGNNGNLHTAEIWDVASATKLKAIQNVSEAITLDFSPDSKKVLIGDFHGGLKVFDVASGGLLLTLKENLSYENSSLKRNIKSAKFSRDGTKIISALDAPGTYTIWDATSGDSLKILNWGNPGLNIEFEDVIHFSKDLRKTFKVLINDYQSSGLITRSAEMWDYSNGKKMKDYSFGDNSSLGDISFSGNTFTVINNSGIKLFDLTTGEHLFSFYGIDSTDWAVMHPSGLFDASPGAMEKMFWLKGDEIIDLNQLKDRYWQPGLWSMIMAGKSLRNVEGMANLKLQPEVKLGEIKDGEITINLKKRDGGYGTVSILVNNKEKIVDARPVGFDTSKLTQSIRINVKDYLADGINNNIQVKVKSADGFISSRGEMDGVDFVEIEKNNKITRKPSFYGIIIGTGEFNNTKMNLKFPVHDAQSMTKTIKLAANNLFGKDSTHVYELSSPGLKASNKMNIQQTFEEIKSKAKAEDIVLVYLSGHGMVHGGEKGDFYYLTTDFSGSSAESLGDPQIRQKQSISTEEFTQWLNGISALKQVMIIDACGSGKAVEKLLAKRDIEASQIKAIDRMRDRTGLFIISGCAADAVSYEASKYGQGLLTYSVIEAIKGAALRDNKYVDILNLLNFSREQVPKMAIEIGGIQQPQLLIPKGGSFDIGIIREEDKAQIPLASIKQIFVRTNLQEENTYSDILKLANKIDEKLNEVSAAKVNDEKSINFIDTDEYPNACKINGRYTVSKTDSNQISFIGKLVCGTNEKKISIEPMNKDKIVEKLVAIALGL